MEPKKPGTCIRNTHFSISTRTPAFPIWWYVAPTVINTFLEAYDFTGKKIVLFATSGSSGFGNTVAELQPSAPNAEIAETKVLSGIITEAKIGALIDACK
mgnify:CR=1 FL=1